ncbi:hypothetical protein [Candidatus Solirubrobacter pratensis]|uniref:hypothetical protein n=1 Tax=Candidatus Solirubrobacter pratensis TaxID=1298857 RepID=UPI0018CB3A5B|nr:hypothetical protein [Candidatus Solirubrobacter pratensis]
MRVPPQRLLALAGAVVLFAAAGTVVIDAFARDGTDRAVATVLIVALLAVAAAAARVFVGTLAARSRGPRWSDAPPTRDGARPPPPPPPRSPAAAPARIVEAQLPRGRSDLVLKVAAAACVTAPLLVLVDAPAWARFPAVLLLLALAPGAALLRVLGRPGRRIEIGAAVGISLAVAVVIAQCMLWIGLWHPDLLVCLLAATCLAALVGRPSGLTWRRRIRARAPISRPGPWSARRRARPRPRRRERTAGLSALLLSEALGPDAVDEPERGTSIVVRARGDPAPPGLALEALPALEAPGERGALEMTRRDADMQEDGSVVPDEPLESRDPTEP